MAKTRFTRARRAPVGGRRDSSTFGSLVRSRIVPGSAGKLSDPYKQHPYVAGAFRLMGQMLGSVPIRIVKPDPGAAAAAKRLRTDLSRDERARTLEALKFIEQTSPIAFRDIGGKGTRSNDEPVVHVPDSPYQEVFDRPNPRFARAELSAATVIWTMGEGNTIWVLERTSATAPPSRITPTSRSGWSYELDADGEIAKWKRKVKTSDGKGTEEVEFEPWEIVHFRIFCPNQHVWGDTPLKGAWSQLEQDVMAGAFNKSFLENGGEPGTVLRLPADSKADDQDVRDILRRWDARHRGGGQANKTAVLVDGMEIDRGGTSHHDMQFTELLESNRDAILAALTLHKAALGVTDALNRATITEARRMVWTNLLGPLATYIEDRLNQSLFAGNSAGHKVMFDLKQVPELQEDLNEKLSAAAQMQELHVPLNDITKTLSLDLPEYPWGDEPLVTLGLVPITHAIENPPTGGGESAGAKPSDTEPPDPDAGEDDDDPEEGRSRASSYKQVGARRDWWRGWWRAVGEDSEQRFKGELKTYWYDMRREQLARFSSIRSTSRAGDDLFTEAHIDRILFDSQPWKERLSTTAERHWQSTGAASLKQLGSEIELSFDLSDSAWERFIEAKKIKVVGITERAREHIRQVMVEAVNEGLTVNETQDKIKAAFNGLASPARRLRIARTEVSSAANGARFLGMKASGVATVEWVTSADREVRETHSLYEAVGPVPINTNFLDYSGGLGTLRTPLDPLAPADEVVNCRCTLIAVEQPAEQS